MHIILSNFPIPSKETPDFIPIQHTNIDESSHYLERT